MVCFDETPVQLIAETRGPVPAQLGGTACFDHEDRRNGTANLLVFLDVHQSWRHAKITERRTNADLVHCTHELLTVHYPGAARVRVVLDNLSTHKPAALYEAIDLVFPKVNGSMWPPTSFDWHYAQVVARAGVGAVGFHDIRDTHATASTSRWCRNGSAMPRCRSLSRPTRTSCPTCGKMRR